MLLLKTYCIRVFQILLDLCIAEDGVAFAHSPKHSLKSLDLHPLNEPRNETAREKGGIFTCSHTQLFHIFFLTSLTQYLDKITKALL